MPFANLTGDADLDYLAEGVSAGLMSLLREEQGLQVVGRSEAWTTDDRSATDLAARLGVGSVVDGEILKTGEPARDHGEPDRHFDRVGPVVPHLLGAER